MHLLYNESTEIIIFIFTVTNSPCVFVFHAESIEIGKPYIETSIDFSYKCLFLLVLQWHVSPQNLDNTCSFLVLYASSHVSVLPGGIHMLRLGKLRQSVYEFEFDFFNEIRFWQTIYAHLD